jgi:hypothetical protein
MRALTAQPEEFHSAFLGSGTYAADEPQPGTCSIPAKQLALMQTHEAF